MYLISDVYKSAGFVLNGVYSMIKQHLLSILLSYIFSFVFYLIVILGFLWLFGTWHDCALYLRKIIITMRSDKERIGLSGPRAPFAIYLSI